MFTIIRATTTFVHLWYASRAIFTCIFAGGALSLTWHGKTVAVIVWLVDEYYSVAEFLSSAFYCIDIVEVSVGSYQGCMLYRCRCGCGHTALARNSSGRDSKQASPAKFVRAAQSWTLWRRARSPAPVNLSVCPVGGYKHMCWLMGLSRAWAGPPRLNCNPSAR